MTHVRHAFEKTIIEIPLSIIICGSDVPKAILVSEKFKTILSSVSKLGIIEPLAVFPSREQSGCYDVLDGRLRLEASKILERKTVPCMISTDDESYTFNRHINRISAIQEHKMIRAALAKGASEKRIAEVLRMDIRGIRLRANLLDGIAPEVAKLLKDRQVIPKVFGILKKMKPLRQIEAAEMMIAANKFTATYVDMILVTTRPDALQEGVAPKKKEEISAEDLTRMEAEMDRLRQDCQAVEDSMGDTMLSLVVAKGFMSRLLRNDNVHGHLKKHHDDLLGTLVSTMQAIAADNRASERE